MGTYNYKKIVGNAHRFTSERQRQVFYKVKKVCEEKGVEVREVDIYDLKDYKKVMREISVELSKRGFDTFGHEVKRYKLK